MQTTYWLDNLRITFYRCHTPAGKFEDCSLHTLHAGWADPVDDVRKSGDCLASIQQLLVVSSALTQVECTHQDSK